MAHALAKKVETSTTLLEAAKKVLRQNGYAGLSTRDVAATAGVPLSQIHYHFGSKQGLVMALFEYLNAQLLDRQNALFADTALSVSQRWDRACEYLDDDIASGYVRVLQELIAASWSDAAVAKAVRAAGMGWIDLIVAAARKAELLRELDQRGRGMGEEIAQLTASYAEARRVVTIANSDGLFTADDRTRTRIGVQTVARRGEKVETGAETLAVACPFCTVMLDDGVRSSGRDMRVADVATLLVEAVEPQPPS